MMLWLLLIALTATLAAGKDCEDKLKNCAQYEKMFCTSTQFKPWMRRNCEKYCGFCSTGGNGGTVAPTGCKDKVGNCAIYDRQFCQSHMWMKANCRNYCNLCSTGGKRVTALPPRSCGKVMIPQGRVIGGSDAKPGAWPWQVAIYVWGRFWCGGSVINNRWFVTAAHCARDYKPWEFEIKLGVHNRDDEADAQTFEISRIIVHPEYNLNKQLNNDIALFELKKPIKFNNKVQPVCLPSSYEKPDVGSTCYITGWGKMQFPGKTVKILQQLGLKVQSNSACAQKNRGGFTVTDKMICAGNPSAQENQSGCQGDSGGPFVCQQPDNSWKLHGAVSWGSSRCNGKAAFSVFARISEFRSWIDQNVY